MMKTLLALLLLLVPCTLLPAADKPNVLFIAVDDLIFPTPRMSSPS